MRNNIVKCVVTTDKTFLFDDNNILEWFVQNSVQHIFIKVLRSTLR